MELGEPVLETRLLGLLECLLDAFQALTGLSEGLVHLGQQLQKHGQVLFGSQRP